MKALVTGATGFIGSNLVRRLLESGYEVRALVLPGENLSPSPFKEIEVVHGNVTMPETLSGIGEGIDIVFHLVARVADWGSMELFRTVTSYGTSNVLRECVGRVERFIYLSSIAAYGMGRHLKGLKEEAERIRTGIPYCDTKIEAEDLVAAYTFGTDTSSTIIRPANVIGPGSVWVKDVLDAFQRGPVPLCDGGVYSGSFIYVENLVEGILKAASSDLASNRIYNFRDDYRVTWKEYLTELGSLVGKKPGPSMTTSFLFKASEIIEQVYLPFYPARPPLTRMAVGVIGFDNDVDIERASTELSWKTIVPYERAMEAIKEWFYTEYLPGKRQMSPGKCILDFKKPLAQSLKKFWKRLSIWGSVDVSFIKSSLEKFFQRHF